MSSTSIRSQWRWPVAALLVEVAAVHAVLVPAHLREAPYAGALFIALSAAALMLAGLILVRDRPLSWVAAGMLCAGAIAAYVISRSVGLPLMSDDVGDWLNPLGVGALTAETIAVAICVLAVGRPGSPQPARGSRVTPAAMGSA